MPHLLGGVLILAEVKVFCHQLPSALALAVSIGCQCGKAIAHNLLADSGVDSGVACDPSRERISTSSHEELGNLMLWHILVCPRSPR